MIFQQLRARAILADSAFPDSGMLGPGKMQVKTSMTRGRAQHFVPFR